MSLSGTRAFWPGALIALRSGPQTMVALDIDGTIMGHDGSLSDGVRQSISDVVADGTHVVLATGRSLTAVLPVAEQLGLRGWAVCSNGSVTISMDGEGGYEVVDLVTFDPGPTLRLLREHAPTVLFAVEDIGRGFKVTEHFPLGELGGRQDVVSFEELCAMPASRVTVRGPDLTAEDFHDLVERSGLHGVSYAVGWTAWLDINPPGISKASALEVVRQRLDIAADHTLAAGDGRNDIEMLTWAEYGISMGGADEDTMDAADFHAGPVDDDGLVPVLAGLR